MSNTFHRNNTLTDGFYQYIIKRRTNIDYFLNWKRQIKMIDTEWKASWSKFLKKFQMDSTFTIVFRRWLTIMNMMKT